MDTNNAATKRKTCHLGWHITHRCNLSCKHCLRRTPGRSTMDLSREKCHAILESYLQFARDNKRAASIQFSGGNPLLRKDFPKLLQTASDAKRQGVVSRIQILGNPETLDDGTVDFLKTCEIDDFTISLDGLEEANDRMRGPGNFCAALNGIRKLVKAGVPTSVKFTLVRDNADQLIEVVKLARVEGARHVGVGHLIIAGGGYELRHKRFSPPEYREFLLNMLQSLDSLSAQYADFRRSFLRHNGMYALLFHELGRMEEYTSLVSNRQQRMHSNGNVMFVVWSDGEVVLRRELPRQGYVPFNTFQEIYDASPMLKLMEDKNYLRDLAKESQRNHVKCSVCPVAEYCLPRMVGIFGYQPYFAPNRDCWR